MFYKNKKVTERKDGRLMLKFKYNNKYYYCYGKTKYELGKKYKAKLFYLEQNQNKENTKIITLSDWINEWFIIYKLDKSSSTQYAIKNIINNYIKKSNFYNLEISKINIIDINLFLSDIKFKRTKEYTYIILKDIFDKAVKNDITNKNIIINIERPNYNKKETVYLDSEDFNIFFKAIESSKFKLLYSLILTTGLRIGEALAINKNDIDVTTNTIKIDKSKDKEIELKVKSKNSHRIIKVPDKIITALLNYENDYLFNDFNRNYVFRDFKKIKEQLPNKYKNLTIHGLRHSYASFLLEKNVDMKSIQFLLGHSKLSTTSDIYLHINKALSNKNNQVNKIFDNYLTTF